MVLAIRPPFCTAAVPALTVTVPALPDCDPCADAAISVKPPPPPSSASAPGVVTATEPPTPVPLVLLLMKASLSIDTLPAFTRTAPAKPELPGAASLLTPLRKPPLFAPSMVSAPPTVSAISPPLPEPDVSLVIEPPRTRLSAPTSSVIVPALPPLAGAAGPCTPPVFELDRTCAPVVTATGLDPDRFRVLTIAERALQGIGRVALADISRR